MKFNYFKKASALLFASMMIISCKCDKKHVPDDPIEPPVEEVKPPRNLIAIDTAKAMQKRYVETRSSVLEHSLKYTDNRDFAFTIAEMERYIAYVKEHYGNVNYEKVNLRFYLSVYSQQQLETRGIVEDFDSYPEGLSTVFMAPDVYKPVGKGAILSVPAAMYQGAPQPDNRASSGRPPHDYNP